MQGTSAPYGHSLQVSCRGLMTYSAAKHKTETKPQSVSKDSLQECNRSGSSSKSATAAHLRSTKPVRVSKSCILCTAAVALEVSVGRVRWTMAERMRYRSMEQGRANLKCRLTRGNLLDVVLEDPDRRARRGVDHGRPSRTAQQAHVVARITFPRPDNRARTRARKAWQFDGTGSGARTCGAQGSDRTEHAGGLLDCRADQIHRRIANAIEEGGLARALGGAFLRALLALRDRGRTKRPAVGVVGTGSADRIPVQLLVCASRTRLAHLALLPAAELAREAWPVPARSPACQRAAQVQGSKSTARELGNIEGHQSHDGSS